MAGGGRIGHVTAPRSRAEQKRHTRALIVEAGRRAVATRGFDGLVVRELAREAGLVPTAFYRHFDSVDDLASELAAGAADALGQLVDQLVATPSGAGAHLTGAGEPGGDPTVDWPHLAAEAATRDGQTWGVLARGLVDTAHPEHRVLSAAVDSARRRLGITLGRLELLHRADDTVVDIAADLVVVVLLRLLMDVAARHDPRTAADESTARLRVILAGAAAT